MTTESKPHVQEQESAGSLVPRFIITVTFERRSIPSGCVARRSYILDIIHSSRLARRAPRRSRYVTVIMNQGT